MSEASTWVVFNIDTGESTEEMRFGKRRDALEWIGERCAPWHFGMREET